MFEMTTELTNMTTWNKYFAAQMRRGKSLIAAKRLAEYWMTSRDYAALKSGDHRLPVHVYSRLLESVATTTPSPEPAPFTAVYDSEKERLTSVLRELGETVDDVARNLRECHVRGYRCNCAECPLAAYLVKAHGSWRVTVTHDGITADGVGVKTPAVLADFMDAFDSGHYDELHREKQDPASVVTRY